MPDRSVSKRFSRRNSSSARLRIESLEERRLLDAGGGQITIVGFSDYEGDGVRGDYFERDIDELIGFQLYFDSGDGEFDPSLDTEIPRTSHSFGESFENLEIGKYFAVAPDRAPGDSLNILSSPKVQEFDLLYENSGTFILEFGYWFTGTSSISIFSDLNADGVRGEDEPLASGLIKVSQLQVDSDYEQSLVAVDGQTSPYWSSDGSEDVYRFGTGRQDGLITTTPDPVTLTYEATVHKEVEFGVVEGASIEAMVVSDRTSNGRTEDDSLIGFYVLDDYGLKVRLTGEAYNGTVIDTLLEDPVTGDLLPGEYQIELVTDDSTFDVISTEQLKKSFTLAAGDARTISFPVFLAEPITGGFSFRDYHGSSFAGINVELFCDDGDGVFDPQVDTLLTAYVTTGPATYELAHPGPGNFFLASRTGTQYTASEIDHAHFFEAESMVNPEGPYFPRARIWGDIYADANQNGRFEPVELGLMDETVVLEGIDIFGNAISRTATSHPYGPGEFLFYNLLPGTYSMIPIQPAGYEAGNSAAGDFGGTASANRIDNIVVPVGEEGYGYRFGVFGEPNTRIPQLENASQIGVFDPQASFAYLTQSEKPGRTWAAYQYGPAGSQAVIGDWDHDNYDAVGVFESNTGLFRLKNQNRNSSNANDLTPFIYGAPGFVAISGDWDGDGFDSVGVYDPATSNFYLRNSNDSGVPDAAQFTYGRPGWVPLSGDWNGDGLDGIGVYDPETAVFYLRNTLSAGVPEIAPFNYGMPGWKPIVGDWDDDGIETVGVYNPPTATYFLRNSNTSGVADLAPINYGLAGWDPIVGRWNSSLAALTVPIHNGGSVVVSNGAVISSGFFDTFLDDYLHPDETGLSDAELSGLAANQLQSTADGTGSTIPADDADQSSAASFTSSTETTSEPLEIESEPESETLDALAQWQLNS